MNEREDVGCADDISDHEYNKDYQQYPEDVATRIQCVNVPVDTGQFTVCEAVDAALDLVRADAQGLQLLASRLLIQ